MTGKGSCRTPTTPPRRRCSPRMLSTTSCTQCQVPPLPTHGRPNKPMMGVHFEAEVVKDGAA